MWAPYPELELLAGGCRGGVGEERTGSSTAKGRKGKTQLSDTGVSLLEDSWRMGEGLVWLHKQVQQLL